VVFYVEKNKSFPVLESPLKASLFDAVLAANYISILSKELLEGMQLDDLLI